MRNRLFWVGLIVTLIAPQSRAELKLAPTVTDHMVLQRDQPLPIWGWDNPNTEVTVSINGASESAQAGADGKWTVKLPAMKVGGPFEMSIKGSSSATIKDVLVGEVWFCSGQSNMEWTVKNSNNAAEEISAGDHPRIRHIKIPHNPADKPRETVQTTGWQVSSPKTVGEFTAVGYYFARHIEKELDVPVGIIGCNWGGTRIEPWTPPVGFKSVPALKGIVDKLDDFPSKNPNGSINHQTPLALYNGMVHPLVPYAIRGALWYQGESNNGEGMLYFEKMKALIGGWRSVWHNDDIPFLFVQLAPFKYRGNPEALAGIWEAQLKSLSIPNTGMAVTVDISNLTDIHPKNKQDVGKRLALWALANTYGKTGIVFSGPLYKSMKVEGNKVRLSFDHVGGGLVSRNGKDLDWFTVAGSDKKFHKAVATIDGNDVVVSAEGVAEPAAVRFGWHQEAEPNLSNKEGLPASPFRTDSW